MNVADAAHAVVHDYPGGTPALAPRLGMSAAILRNKVNTNCDTHHLTLAEAVRITTLTDDPRILQAFAQETGRVALEAPTGDDAHASDMAVLELVVAVMAGQGDLGSIIHRALADGDLTPAEFSQIESAASASHQKIAALVRRLRGMVDAG